MAKNLVFYLDIPLDRRHEIAWILVKNNFKQNRNFQNIFYNSEGDLIYLKYIGKTKGPYEFEVQPIEDDIPKEKIHLSGYEEIESFIKYFTIPGKINNVKRTKS